MSDFKVGDRVSWNSEAGHVTGHVTHVYSKIFFTTGKDGTKYTRHATRKNPQYALKSDISDHIAHHFGMALHKIK